jgi:hypothetical protein
MHDGPSALGHLRDFYDGIGGGRERPLDDGIGGARDPDNGISARDLDDGEAVEPRRGLIPDYEVYEPPPLESRWLEDVQFVAFLVMLCLAVLLVLTVLISVMANGRLDVPWFSNIQIILGVGTGVSFMIALLEKLLP